VVGDSHSEGVFRYSSAGFSEIQRGSFLALYAHATSAHGEVTVGGTVTVELHHRAARFEANGSITLLPVPAEATASEAVDVSADGTIIVGTVWYAARLLGEDMVQPTQPVRWDENGNWELLGELDPNGASSSTGVSFDGSVVVGTDWEGGWVFDTTHGRRNLKALLTAAGADLSDWHFNGLSGISGDGRYVIGSAQYLGEAHPNHEQRAFVARLP
jgi:uncharacterized membrane protein